MPDAGILIPQASMQPSCLAVVVRGGIELAILCPAILSSLRIWNKFVVILERTGIHSVSQEMEMAFQPCLTRSMNWQHVMQV